MKWLITVLTIGCLLTGCYNYKDIDELFFATATMIDTDDKGNCHIYIRAFKGIKTLKEGEVTGEIILFHSQGPTMFTAIRDLTRDSNAKINFSQNKIVVFTEKVAKQSVQPFMDLLIRGQEYNLRMMLVVFEGNLEELIDVELKEENNLGIYLWEVQKNTQKQSGEVNIAYLNDFLNNIYDPSKTNVVPLLEINEIGKKTKVSIYGSIVFDEWKKVDSLTNHEVMLFNMLIDELDFTVISATEVCQENNKIAVEILSSETKTRVKEEEGEFIVNKDIKLKAVFAESRKSIKLDEENLKKIESEVSKQIEDECHELIDRFKEKDIDLLHLRTLYEREMRKKPEDDLLKRSVVKLNIDTEIEGSFEYSDYLE